jgi:molybdopterin molybdotransferase
MQAPATPATVLSFEEARHVVEEQAAKARPTEADKLVEEVDLLNASGRILAERVLADRDIPPFPRATRDGYAVPSTDMESLPASLEVIGEIKAGQSAETIVTGLAPGQAVSIMTGAPVPRGSDAVVMVEYTKRDADRVTITRSVAPGENFVARGAEGREGALLLDRGTQLTEAAIALAASVGMARLNVYRRPKIAILTTGDEIVEVAAMPGPTQIRNSNTYSLAAQVQRAGGEPVLLPIAPDESQRLRELIEEGLRFDLLIMTGGVSMGRYDLVEQVLAEMQAEFFFTGAKIQPGRPVVFGKVECGAGAPAREKRTAYFFGLPGNPVSTMVTFELFARPMLEVLAGMSPRRLAFLHARLKSEIKVKTGLKRFLPAMLSGEFEHSNVELVSWQGSGDIAATALSNCYVVVAPDRERIEPGEWVAVMPR